MDKLTFIDGTTHEEYFFEIVDQIKIDDIQYLLVVDEEEEATILKEVQQDEEEVTYELIEDDDEFQRVTLSFMESDEYDVEV